MAKAQFKRDLAAALRNQESIADASAYTKQLMLDAADALAEQAETIERLRAALKDLIRAYVNQLESGRDRIVSLGGGCDPVDVMERGDPYLRRAKEALRGVQPHETTESLGSHKAAEVSQPPDVRQEPQRSDAAFAGLNPLVKCPTCGMGYFKHPMQD